MKPWTEARNKNKYMKYHSKLTYQPAEKWTTMQEASGLLSILHGPLARYVKLRFAHVPEMPGTFSPSPRVSDPDIHHGTCVTHVPWYMSGSLTRGFPFPKSVVGKMFPVFPAHAQPAILRIWKEVHDRCWFSYSRSVNDAIGNQIGLHWVICPIAVVY